MAQALMVMSMLGAGLAVSAGGPGASEYQVKAAYVFKLSRFVEWPAEAFKSASQPMVLCVLGSSPIQPVLAEAARVETIDGRRMEVHQLSDTGSAAGCHVAFIAASERPRMSAILRTLRAPGTLTVGETEDFLKEGGAVNFRLESDKVRIEINLTAVTEHKLRVSPNLLSLVRVVRH